MAIVIPAGASPTNPATTFPMLQGAVVDFGCGLARLPRQARCLGKAVASPQGKGPAVNTGPVGYGPTDIQAAYKLTGLKANGRTVAIVDAFDDPLAEADLGVYRAAHGLPACTTANGCFRKVNQRGQDTPLPKPDYGWAEEISLDLDAVSAACPDCRILLVEADTPDTDPLMAAVDTAAKWPGVVAVSNSYGGNEDSTVHAADSHLNHPGVAITASSGDSGYGVIWPASSPYVTAVGGTTLHPDPQSARGWAETAWSGAGSGCSSYENKPAWQKTVKGGALPMPSVPSNGGQLPPIPPPLPGIPPSPPSTGDCTNRMVSDVAALADPATGLGVYDSYNDCGDLAICDQLIGLGLAQGARGWIQVGGTSLSSPLIASVYALAGNTGSISNNSYPYSHTSALFDVTVGSNGLCFQTPLCTAGPGYDGPTGLGTPNGTGAF